MPRSLTLVWDQVFPELLLALVLQAAEPQTSALERGSRKCSVHNKTIALGSVQGMFYDRWLLIVVVGSGVVLLLSGTIVRRLTFQSVFTSLLL